MLEWLREIRRKMAKTFNDDPKKAGEFYRKMARRPGVKLFKREKGGVAKMEIKHAKELKDLPVTLAKGKIVPHDKDPENKKFVIHKNNIAVLSKVNEHKSWAITHFEDPEKIKELEQKSRPSWMSGK